MREWVDHTAELELRVQAATAEAVVDEATGALGEVLGEAEGEATARPLAVEARDRPGLLAAWLEELVFLAEDEGLVPHGAREVELGPARLAGIVEGRHGRPSHLVKAVTLHRLAFAQEGGTWSARVVLDV